MQSRMLLVYEKEDFNGTQGSATPVFSTHIRNIQSVEARRFVSSHGRYAGGRLRIFGTFDRGHPEKITLKMVLPEYEAFVSALACLRR